MKKTKSIIIGLAVIFLLANTAYAKAEGEFHQRGEGQKESIFKELNLTLEQKKKLEENRSAQRTELKKIHAAIKEKQAKIQEALKAPRVSRNAIEPLVNDIKSLQGRLIDCRINGIFAVKEILTPEQLAKFQQIADNRKENRRNRLNDWSERRKGIN
ncbi:MAG: Spy/CpxP family protein refolding chaperone [Candidatus Omnitrophica bacterium]|nr:Spy/CpxP family protein refolding chaperone [Candidatus Omnitrophota bacterium]MDD5661417.1 Spy/CpxP family protein refolding chaperone [Candidatus Omnitrophota bacterium]